jgi:hypothetical protein
LVGHAARELTREYAYHPLVEDIRQCAYCGTAFTPRREHARFCSAACLAAWQRARTGDPVVGLRALQWSVPGMSGAIRVLALVRGSDRAAAFDAIGDAVWAVTIVDAALVRYHPDAYDDLLATESREERQLVERTLAGLRFVRNHIAVEDGVASFVEPGTVDPVADGGVMRWRWKPVPEPRMTGREPRARSWEAARYRAYQSALADQTLAEIFARAEVFLLRAAAAANLITDEGVLPGAPRRVVPGAREG